MRTLLLTAAGTLALSTAALAADAQYEEVDGIYTFTTGGTCTVDLSANPAVKGVVLSENVQLEYDDLFIFNRELGSSTLTLDRGSKFIGTEIVALTDSSGAVVNGSSGIETTSDGIAFSRGFLTLNADLTLTAATSIISLVSTSISMNLDNAGLLMGAFLTLDTPTAHFSEEASFNLQFNRVLSGDYKLLTLRNAAINTETNRDAILTGNFKLNNETMTPAQKEKLSWNGNTLVYSAGAIPEPSLFGVLAGLGALALASTRRRRK